MAEKEYIEREAAIGEIEEWYDMYPESDVAREALSMAKRAILNLPAADVREVVPGSWKRNERGNYNCSNCKSEHNAVFGFIFCPNCGADMREVS